MLLLMAQALRPPTLSLHPFPQLPESRSSNKLFHLKTSVRPHELLCPFQLLSKPLLRNQACSLGGKSFHEHLLCWVLCRGPQRWVRHCAHPLPAEWGREADSQTEKLHKVRYGKGIRGRVMESRCFLNKCDFKESKRCCWNRKKRCQTLLGGAREGFTERKTSERGQEG